MSAHAHEDEPEVPTGGAVEEEHVAAEAAEVEPLGEDVEFNRDLVENIAMSLEGQVDPEERQKELKRLMKLVQRAKSAEHRVEIFSKIADWGFLDPIIGALFPAAGDAATAAIELGYLVVEANIAGLPLTAQAKIAAYQLVDLAIGFTPVIGDFADALFMANRMSAAEFRKHTLKLAEEFRKSAKEQEDAAREAGYPSENVDAVLARGESFRKALAVADKVVKEA